MAADKESNVRGFNVRGFVSLLTAGGFLVMTVTGIILYVVPPGRVANWTDWTILGMGKEEWGAIHIVSSFLFVVPGIVHLIYNWKPFKHYIVEKLRQGGEHMRLEGLLATGAMIVIVAGTMLELPPFQYIIDLNTYFKDSWSVGSGAEPPFGHAEEVSLENLAYKIHVDADAAVAALTAAGLTVDGKVQTLRDVADANALSPAEVYDIVWKALGPKKGQGTKRAKGYTAEQVELEFAGTGIGRKTIAQIAEERGFAAADLQAKLAAAGLEAGANVRLKDLADENGYEPMELFKTLMIDGYAPVPSSGE